MNDIDAALMNESDSMQVAGVDFEIMLNLRFEVPSVRGTSACEAAAAGCESWGVRCGLHVITSSGLTSTGSRWI